MILAEAGLLKQQCPKCNTIFNLVEKENDRCRCPNPKCNHNSWVAPFKIFPPLPSIDLFYSLFELYELANSKQKEIVNSLIEKLHQITNNRFHYNEVNNVLEKIIKIQNNTEICDIGKVDKIRMEITYFLKVGDSQKIEDAYSVIANGDNINRLCKAIIILSASTIEIMFKSFMEDAVTKITNADICKNLMSKLERATIEEHLRHLNIFMDFKKEIEGVAPTFWTQWDTIRKDRNTIIHRNNRSVYWDRVKEIFELAKGSVEVFEKLNNKIIVD